MIDPASVRMENDMRARPAPDTLDFATLRTPMLSLRSVGSDKTGSVIQSDTSQSLSVGVQERSNMNNLARYNYPNAAPMHSRRCARTSGG